MVPRALAGVNRANVPALSASASPVTAPLKVTSQEAGCGSISVPRSMTFVPVITWAVKEVMTGPSVAST